MEVLISHIALPEHNSVVYDVVVMEDWLGSLIRVQK